MGLAGAAGPPAGRVCGARATAGSNTAAGKDGADGSAVSEG